MVSKKSLANLKPAKPGEVRNPEGRPTGTRDAITKRFLIELGKDFNLHGAQAIVEMREKDVVRYVLCVAGLVPKEIEHKYPLEGLSDDELSAGIAFLQARLAASGVQPGADEAGSAAQAH